MKDSAPELNVSSSEAEEEREEARLEGEQDPDFNQVPPGLLVFVLELWLPFSFIGPEQPATKGAQEKGQV